LQNGFSLFDLAPGKRKRAAPSLPEDNFAALEGHLRGLRGDCRRTHPLDIYNLGTLILSGVTVAYNEALGSNGANDGSCWGSSQLV
jgi:hypothetical protein